jgi:hypothetical protein
MTDAMCLELPIVNTISSYPPDTVMWIVVACPHQRQYVYLLPGARHLDGTWNCELESTVHSDQLVLRHMQLAPVPGVAWLSYTICMESQVSNKEMNARRMYKSNAPHRVDPAFTRRAMTSAGAAPLSTVNTAARGPHYYYLFGPCIPRPGIL